MQRQRVTSAAQRTGAAIAEASLPSHRASKRVQHIAACTPSTQQWDCAISSFRWQTNTATPMPGIATSISPIKLALALAAAALALAAAQRAPKRPTKQRKEGVLGERCDAPETYAPDVLFPIPRTRGRRLLGLEDGAPLPIRR